MICRISIVAAMAAQYHEQHLRLPSKCTSFKLDMNEM